MSFTNSKQILLEEGSECAVDKLVNEFELLFQAFEYICHSKLKYENEMGKIQN